jgi:hypothetical protein
MDNEQLNVYNKLQSEIMEKVIEIKCFENLQQYKISYEKFFTNIQELQQKYEKFNREVIRKYHIFNPITPGKYKYFEELVGETWYFFIHVPSYEPIIKECLLNGKSFRKFMNMERQIVELFNQDLYLNNFYLYCEKFLFEHQGFSMLDFETMIYDKQDEEICRLFFTNAIEYPKFNDYVMTCLDNNSSKLEKLLPIIIYYKPLFDKYNKLCKDFIRTQYSSINSIRDIYVMYMQLLEYSSTLDSNVIQNEIKYKLSNQEYDLALMVFQDRKYNILVPFCSNEEFFCNYLMEMIKKESIIKSFMNYNNLPTICEPKYQKLLFDFGQESYIYDKLFVFNDTFHYKIQHPLLKIPPCILSMQSIHEENYKKIYPSRKLKWIHENSFLTLNFGQATLKVDFLSFLVIYCFNDHCKLSILKICELTNIPLEYLQIIIHILESKQIIKKYYDSYIVLPNLAKHCQVICIDSLVRSKPTKMTNLCSQDEKIKASIIRELKIHKKILKKELVEKYLSVDVAPIINSLESLGFVEKKGMYIVYA